MSLTNKIGKVALGAVDDVYLAIARKKDDLYINKVSKINIKIDKLKELKKHTDVTNIKKIDEKIDKLKKEKLLIKKFLMEIYMIKKINESFKEGLKDFGKGLTIRDRQELNNHLIMMINKDIKRWEEKKKNSKDPKLIKKMNIRIEKAKNYIKKLKLENITLKEKAKNKNLKESILNKLTNKIMLVESISDFDKYTKAFIKISNMNEEEILSKYEVK